LTRRFQWQTAFAFAEAKWCECALAPGEIAAVGFDGASCRWRQGAGRVISQIGDSDLLVPVLRSAQTFASQSAGSALRLPGISCEQRCDVYVYTR
jgi:hypothetical protein